MGNGVSRRDFMKLTAAAAAFAGSSLDAIAAAETEKIVSHGTHFGPMEAVVKGGRMVDVRPHPLINKMRPMLKSMADFVNSPNRIQNPCVRKSYLEGRKEIDLRGAEPFVEVSWDTALDLIAEKLKETKHRYGNEAIFRTSFAGWGTSGIINRPNTMQGRFLGLFGGFTDTIGDYSAGASKRILPYVMGPLGVYGRQTAYEVILKNTKTVILWGMDPLKSFLIEYGVPIFQKTEWYREMKKAGVKFVNIDPVNNDTAKELGAEWIKVKPGTDIAMIIAMCEHLYSSGKYSKKFIDKYTVGFDDFREYLTGESDGQRKTPQWAESICGVSKEDIVRLAELLLRNDSLIISMYGPQRQQHGEQFHWSLLALASMAGNIGTPGGGLNIGGNWTSLSGRNVPKRVPQGRNPARTVIPASRVGDMLMNPGKTIDFNGGKITYPRVNLIHCSGANAITHHQDTNYFLKGMRNVETVITHEIFWTPTARFSDIVLPVNTQMERDDLGISHEYSVSHVWALKKVVDPAQNSHCDYWIFAQLAKRLGFEDKFTEGRSNFDWVKWSYESAGFDVPFEEFWERGYIAFEKTEEVKNYIHLGGFIADPKKNPVFTPSGKIEIHSEKVASYGYKDCKGHPTWMEPEEWLGGDLAEKHPFHLLSLHPRYRLHSQLDNMPFASIYKVNGREPVVLNPKDAQRYGIEDGDNVEIYNDRGAIVCCAVISNDVMESVIRVDEGAWYAPEIPGRIGTRCLNGNANVLTSDIATSELAQACSAHSCLVSIKKLKGEVKANTAYINPEIIPSNM
jgi:trimethylamine-N-oxide reductase (cytochrome c)